MEAARRGKGGRRKYVITCRSIRPPIPDPPADSSRPSLRFGCHIWLVLGAPDGLLRVVLASVTPISTIKTALPSFDIIFSLVVVAVVVVSL